MRILAVVLLTALSTALARPAYAGVPGSIEVTCDVDRKEFRNLANGATDVTFKLWDAETGGSQCGPDHVVTMQDLRVFKAKTDRFDGQRPRKFGEIRAVLGSDAQPVTLCSGDETWLDVTVGTTTLTCEFSADPNSKPGVPPDAPARRRLQAVPFARECDTCTSTVDVSVRAYSSSNLTIPRGVSTTLVLDSERWDTDSIHCAGTIADPCTPPATPSRLTAATAGKYFIFGHVHWDVPADPTSSYRQVDIQLNGSTIIASDRRTEPAGDQVLQSVSSHFDLDAGDYVELSVHHSALPSTLAVKASAQGSPEFGMVKLP